MIAVLAFPLTACAGLNGLGPDPEAAQPIQELKRDDAKPPAKLTKNCRTPTDLPSRDLSAGEVERLWGDDRVSLIVCGRKHRALRDFYRNRDKLLSGE